jgi:hypothetical protein
MLGQLRNANKILVFMQKIAEHMEQFNNDALAKIRFCRLGLTFYPTQSGPFQPDRFQL